MDKISAQQVAIIIPTKDRNDKLRRVLKDIAKQSVGPIHVIIVDGGKCAKEIAEKGHARMDILYLQSPVAGQIQQRNFALAHLNKKYKLVGFIDDDMELAHDSIQHILEHWNSTDTIPAGIGLNLENASSKSIGIYKRIFLLENHVPGKVLISGANTSINDTNKNIRTQWLGGGYTFWRKEIIDAYPHLPVKTKWAIGEDLRFSYPIGKIYPLWICARAKAKHNHVYNHNDLKRFACYRGHKIAAASLFFVRSHSELNLAACYWMLIGLCLGRVINGIVNQKAYLILEATGIIRAILRSVAAGADRDFLLSEMES